jgi:hypothetical protein
LVSGRWIPEVGKRESESIQELQNLDQILLVRLSVEGGIPLPPRRVAARGFDGTKPSTSEKRCLINRLELDPDDKSMSQKGLTSSPLQAVVQSIQAFNLPI